MDIRRMSIQKYESKEEQEMHYWLIEAMDHGLVELAEYHPRIFHLIDRKSYKFAGKTKSLYQKATYEPDFYIKFTLKGLPLMILGFQEAFVWPFADRAIFNDVKGKFAKNGGAVFSIKQKLTFLKYGFFVQKTIPWYTSGKKKVRKGLFVDTFAPQSLRYKPVQGGLNIVGKSCRSIEQFMQEECSNVLYD